MAKTAAKSGGKSGITVATATPIERATLSVPANAVSFLVPPKQVVQFAELWVNPACVYAQMLEISRYIQAPAGDYREVLLPTHWVKGNGAVPTGNWRADAVPHPSLFIVRCSHVRNVKGAEVTYGSFPVSFSRAGDIVKMEFEDIGAPPTDLRLAFQVLSAAKAAKASK